MWFTCKWINRCSYTYLIGEKTEYDGKRIFVVPRRVWSGGTRKGMFEKKLGASKGRVKREIMKRRLPLRWWTGKKWGPGIADMAVDVLTLYWITSVFEQKPPTWSIEKSIKKGMLGMDSKLIQWKLKLLKKK